MTDNFPLLDAHHHLWAPESDPDDMGYGWLRDIGAPKPFGDPTPIQRDYLLAEFRDEPLSRQMRGSVHIQADPKIPDPVKETAWIQRQSDEAGFPVMIVAFADLAAGTFAEQAQRHMEHPNMRGIRQIIAHLPDRPDLSFLKRNMLDDLTWRAQFAMLGDLGLSFDLMAYPGQLRQAAELLADHPDIPVVLEHLGCPYDHSDEGLALWSDGIAALAKLSHVRVKLSGYAMYFKADLGKVAADVTQTLLGAFGPERCMFGSNFPVDRLHLTYPDLVDFVKGQVGSDEAALRQVFHDTAAAFYRF